MDEIFPLVNSQGEVIGSATRKECHSGSMLLHPVIHLHLFNSAGEIYLQKRALTKDIQPGKWDTAVGGHIDLGETPDEAVRREAREELGVEVDDMRKAMQYVFRSEIEQELVYTYVTVYDGVITPDKKELEGGRFWTRQEVEQTIGKGLMTPNFEGEIEQVLAFYFGARANN